MTPTGWPSDSGEIQAFRQDTIKRLESVLESVPKCHNPPHRPGHGDHYQLEAHIFQNCESKELYMRTMTKVIKSISDGRVVAHIGGAIALSGACLDPQPRQQQLHHGNKQYESRSARSGGLMMNCPWAANAGANPCARPSPVMAAAGAVNHTSMQQQPNHQYAQGNAMPIRIPSASRTGGAFSLGNLNGFSVGSNGTNGAISPVPKTMNGFSFGPIPREMVTEDTDDIIWIPPEHHSSAQQASQMNKSNHMASSLQQTYIMNTSENQRSDSSSHSRPRKRLKTETEHANNSVGLGGPGPNGKTLGRPLRAPENVINQSYYISQSGSMPTMSSASISSQLQDFSASSIGTHGGSNGAISPQISDRMPWDPYPTNSSAVPRSSIPNASGGNPLGQPSRMMATQAATGAVNGSSTQQHCPEQQAFLMDQGSHMTSSQQHISPDYDVFDDESTGIEFSEAEIYMTEERNPVGNHEHQQARVIYNSGGHPVGRPPPTTNIGFTPQQGLTQARYVSQSSSMPIRISSSYRMGGELNGFSVGSNATCGSTNRAISNHSSVVLRSSVPQVLGGSSVDQISYMMAAQGVEELNGIPPQQHSAMRETSQMSQGNPMVSHQQQVYMMNNSANQHYDQSGGRLRRRVNSSAYSGSPAPNGNPRGQPLLTTFTADDIDEVIQGLNQPHFVSQNSPMPVVVSSASTMGDAYLLDSQQGFNISSNGTNGGTNGATSSHIGDRMPWDPYPTEQENPAVPSSPVPHAEGSFSFGQIPQTIDAEEIDEIFGISPQHYSPEQQALLMDQGHHMASTQPQEYTINNDVHPFDGPPQEQQRQMNTTPVSEYIWDQQRETNPMYMQSPTMVAPQANNMDHQMHRQNHPAHLNQMNAANQQQAPVSSSSVLENVTNQPHYVYQRGVIPTSSKYMQSPKKML